MNLKKTEVVTGKVRLNFPVLFTPKADKNDPTKINYSCQLLIPKSDTATMAKIREAIEEAKREGLGKKWGGTMPPNISAPYHDGDGIKPVAGTEYGPECKGHYILNVKASASYKPDVVDGQLNPILDQSEIYSGMYARVLINFFPYFNSGKKGISVSFSNVQKVADGTPLGGAPKKSADVFGEVKYDDLTGEVIV
ncbi:DUF2815 family protein [Sebaldella sp. S0638]|uniref:DUF2815 family protein n=1 Tax=Sebaldella sp. S0638 TaxID=2957809 RepID=UPI0020A0515E|nr:DUF2815 family protein [Sebaldella sp. S0638]MCP1225700.1 DUF2815 family protein [Sebaldella sp. S0638]